LDKQTTNSAGITYALTPKGSKPIIAVDRATKSEPWYEHESPSHRDSRSIKVADPPAADEDLFKVEFARSDRPSSVTSRAHLVTYLVRDDKVLFRAATDVEWLYTKDNQREKGPTYKLSGKTANKLDSEHRAALVRDFPEMDYLP
jgi:hypothetical protein